MRAAKIENNIVVQVIEGSHQWANEKLGGTWVDINGFNIGLGYTYNSNSNTFTPPKPYPSWTLIDNVWVAPKPYPNDGKYYDWDEESQSWVKIIVNENSNL
jgi:hypothetical protein